MRWPIRYFALVIIGALVLSSLPAEALLGLFDKHVAPTFKEGDAVPLIAGSLTSKSKVLPRAWREVFSCATNDDAGAAVKATGGGKPVQGSQNIGQSLMGDLSTPSGISLTMLRNVSCEVFCDVTQDAPAKSKGALTRIERLVNGNYKGNLFLSGLPASDGASHSRHRKTGFMLGTPSTSLSPAKLNNHLALSVYYHEDGVDRDDGHTVYSIVGFSVTAMSTSDNAQWCRIGQQPQFDPQLASATQITYSYSVAFIPSQRTWSTRWEAYIQPNPAETRMHWMTAFIFLFVVLIQSAALWTILIRALRRDISYYNSDDAEKEESGWKLVHGDVLRKPRAAGFLSMLAGTGCQLVCMLATTLFAACMGFFSPGSRGLLATYLVFSFIMCSAVNGFVTAAFLKYFRIRSWRYIFTTAIAFPGVVFSVYLALNFVHLGYRAVSTMSLGMLLRLLSLWVGISTPLCLLGAVCGFRVPIPADVRINNIPRTVPPQPWYMASWFSYVSVSGVAFSASILEVYFILNSMWQGTLYYMFSCLAVVCLLVTALTAQGSIFSTYLQLNFLDYHWWWRSFIVSASYGLWLAAYCVYYYAFVSIIHGFWGTMLYFGYMSMFCLAISIMLGAVGVLAALVFVHLIYSSVKLD